LSRSPATRLGDSDRSVLGPWVGEISGIERPDAGKARDYATKVIYLSKRCGMRVPSV